MRAVTLQGDDFNPVGTLTGGSRSKHTLLDKMAEPRFWYSRIEILKTECKEVDGEIDFVVVRKNDYVSYFCWCRFAEEGNWI